MQRYGNECNDSVYHICEKVSREKRIPFEINTDPFYSESNMRYLEKVIADIESGKVKLVEHDLIEE